MKLAAMVVMAIGANAWASTARVTVCLSPGSQGGLVGQAETLATGIFAAGGVEVDWHKAMSCPASPDVIRISFEDATPRNRRPGALAYALPFEGTHIVVFSDRVNAISPAGLLPRLMAYVMVHEITHILQGIDRHSATGIMKARWGYKDYYAMRENMLTFTEQDLDLLHRGLDLRTAHLATVAPPIATR